MKRTQFSITACPSFAFYIVSYFPNRFRWCFACHFQVFTAQSLLYDPCCLNRCVILLKYRGGFSNLHSLITDLILYHIDRRLVVHSGGNKCYFRLSVVSNSSPNHYRSFISQIMKVITATIWSNFNSFSFFFSYFIVPESLITRRIVCVHATICRALRENFDGSRKWQAYFSQLNYAIYLKPPFTVVPLCCSSQHSWVSYFSIIMWGKLKGFYWVAE